MSPRSRVVAVVAAASVIAAGATVALAVVTAKEKGGSAKSSQPLPGAPPYVLDLGVRDDLEARSLRRADRLYAQKKRAAAREIFARFDSAEAQVGAALAAWPDSSLARVEQLARQRPRNSFVLLHLGYARLWAGKAGEAGAAWREALRAEPDTPSAQRADDALHPRFPQGQPFFVPSGGPPGSLDRLTPPRQLRELARAARRRDVHAKLLYGLALQRLGHRVSAQREYDEAAGLAPRDPDARVAAAVVRFEKAQPAAAFSRLGPLTRRFPRSATVRFHLGLLLFWLADVQPGAVKEGKRQLRLAQTEEPGSPLAAQARTLLDALASRPNRH